MSEACSDFLSVKSRNELAIQLGLSEKQLCFYAFSDKTFYSSFNLPKSNGVGVRRIDAPHKNLRDIQRILADKFSKIYDPTDAAFGFVRNRSTADNAYLHIKKRWVVRIDLKDFFTTITAARIHGLFRNVPFEFNDVVANVLTNLVCYRGCLPQGAPTSPILSNIICYRMDKSLTAFARKHAMKYSRYADDLIFSSTKKGAVRCIIRVGEDGSPVIGDEIKQIIQNNGFNINNEKTGLFSKGTRQMVTGIVVNEKCNFRRDEYRYLRSLFHHWEKHGEESAAKYYVYPDSHRRYESRLFTSEGDYKEGSLPAHVRGILDYYTMIHKTNKRHSEPLQRLWSSLCDVTGERVPEMLPERSVLRMDVCYMLRKRGENDLKDDGDIGSAFIVKDHGLLTACHCVQDISSQGAEYSDYLLTIESRGKKREMFEVHDREQFIRNLADDWALLRSIPKEFEKIPGLPLAEARPVLQRGEKVIAFGYANGERELRRIEAKITEVLGNVVVVDRAFITGMSGGPVLNGQGEVIGLVTKGSGEYTYDRDDRFLLLDAIPAMQ
ncbi:MAG: reverse transcriptase domain-containing protein [Coriobacteriales bacterium]|nr:reverse transcriptase domain-containing protein [Coriobacteriales bacterium]